jgi:hypothetical protein
LALQIRQRSPYAHTGHYAAASGGDVLAWIWDAERVGAALQEHNLNPARVRVLPESLLHPPLGDAVALRACLEGVEGQVWREGGLAASRWWPRPPEPAEWIGFQRDAGVAPEAQVRGVPAPLEAPWLEQPWATTASLAQATGSGARREAWALGAAAAALALATTWYGASIVKLRQVEAERGAELQAAERASEPMRLARGQALEASARAQELKSLDAYPQQLALMATIAEKLPPNGTRLQEWDFREGKLKVIIASPNATASSEYVKSLETAGPFGNVQAAPTADGKGLVLTMDVLPQTGGAEARKPATGS